MKRILQILLVLLILTMMVPFSVLANDDEGDYGGPKIPAPVEPIVDPIIDVFY